MSLVTEDEAAPELRCSVSKVTRLRKTGRLAYIPGRPVLIDLYSFVDAEKVRATSRAPAGPLDAEAQAA